MAFKRVKPQRRELGFLLLTGGITHNACDRVCKRDTCYQRVFFYGYFYFLVLSNMAMAAHALWPVQVEMGLNFLLFGLLIMV